MLATQEGWSGQAQLHQVSCRRPGDKVQVPQVGAGQPGAQVVPMRWQACEDPGKEGGERHADFGAPSAGATPSDDPNPEPLGFSPQPDLCLNISNPLRFSPVSHPVVMPVDTIAGRKAPDSGTECGQVHIGQPETQAVKVHAVQSQPESQAVKAHAAQSQPESQAVKVHAAQSQPEGQADKVHIGQHQPEVQAGTASLRQQVLSSLAKGRAGDSARINPNLKPLDVKFIPQKDPCEVAPNPVRYSPLSEEKGAAEAYKVHPSRQAWRTQVSPQACIRKVRQIRCTPDSISQRFRQLRCILEGLSQRFRQMRCTPDSISQRFRQLRCILEGLSQRFRQARRIQVSLQARN